MSSSTLTPTTTSTYVFLPTEREGTPPYPSTTTTSSYRFLPTEREGTPPYSSTTSTASSYKFLPTEREGTPPYSSTTTTSSYKFLPTEREGTPPYSSTTPVYTYLPTEKEGSPTSSYPYGYTTTMAAVQPTYTGAAATLGASPFIPSQTHPGAVMGLVMLAAVMFGLNLA